MVKYSVKLSKNGEIKEKSSKKHEKQYKNKHAQDKKKAEKP